MQGFIETVNGLIGNNYITVLLVSMVPLIELKGSICWARASGLGFWSSFGTSYLGSTIIGIPVFFLLIPILTLLKKWKGFNKFALKCESYVQSKADGAVQKFKGKKINEVFIKQLAVLIFVAIPLPMTGVWTGTAIAVFLGLKFKEYLPTILIGNFIAGLIISILAELLLAYVDIILWVLFAIAAVLLILLIIKVALSKPKNDNKSEEINAEEGNKE